MGIFDFLKRKSGTETKVECTEHNNFVADMCSAVCEKCEYGDAIEKLNQYERLFYITQTVEQEVNNGGFSQFFYNESGDYANEVVAAFTEIGALQTAEICKKSGGGIR